MENVVVVGGGHVGLTLAVDLELRKNETRLTPHIVQIRDSGHPFGLKCATQGGTVDVEVEDILTGEMAQCQFPDTQIHKTSHDLRAVLANARMIVVTVPDIPHLRQRVFAWIKSNLPDHDMTIVLVRGGRVDSLLSSTPGATILPCGATILFLWRTVSMGPAL